MNQYVPNLNQTTQRNFFRILAGILHLGNVGIASNGGKGDSESSTVEEGDGSLVSERVEEIDLRWWSFTQFDEFYPAKSA